jgi:hypothetical protein
MNSVSTFAELRIVVDPSLDNLPRMQLLPATREIVTPEFAAKMNQWMLEFFGTESRAYMMAGGVMAIGPKAYRALKMRTPPKEA